MQPRPPACDRQSLWNGRARSPDAFGAGIEKTGVQRIKTIGDRQRRHEVAADVPDQTLNLALVVALSGSAKAVVEQVMALEFREHVRAQTSPALHDLGHREPRVVVEDRLRHTAEKSERSDVTIAESFRRLRRIGFDETAVGVGQIHAEVIEPHVLAGDVTIGLAKIRLRLTRAMAQRHEHLAGAQRRLRHVLANDRVAARKAFLRP
jgi:hypothetical protein